MYRCFNTVHMYLTPTDQEVFDHTSCLVLKTVWESRTAFITVLYLRSIYQIILYIFSILHVPIFQFLKGNNFINSILSAIPYFDFVFFTMYNNQDTVRCTCKVRRDFPDTPLPMDPLTRS